MNAFESIPLFASVVNLICAALIIAGRGPGKGPWLWAAFCLNVAVWNLGVWGLFQAETAEAARPFALTTWAGLAPLPALLLHLTVAVAKTGTWRRVRIVSWVAAGAMLVGVFSPWGIVELRENHGAWYSQPTPVIHFFLGALMPGAFLFSGIQLARRVRDSDPMIRRRSRTLMFIMALMPLSGTGETLRLLGLIPPVSTWYRDMPWSSLAACFYGLLAAYVVLTDRVMRTRLRITRRWGVALRVMFFCFLTLLGLLVVQLLLPKPFSGAELAATVGAALTAAVITLLLYPRILSRDSDGTGEQLVVTDKMEAFVERIVFIDDPRTLVTETAELLTTTLGAPTAAVAVFDAEGRLWSCGRAQGQPITFSTRDIAISSNQVQRAVPADLRARFDRAMPDHEQSTGAASTDARTYDLAWPIGLHEHAPLGVMLLGLGRRNLDTDERRVLGRLGRQLAFQFERLSLVRAERLRQVSAAKDRFLASINHEMRNPLNGIRGIVEILAQQAGSPRGRYLLGSLRACADRLEATIDEVVDFSNLDAGALGLKLRDFELNQLIDETCGAYNLQDKQVVREGPEVAAQHLHGDTGKVRQILSNYLDNALKYGEPSRARVRVKVEPAAADGETRVVFEVVSDGPPRNAAEWETLFSPFERGSDTRTTQRAGLGIGLSICRRVAAAMGGRTAARSDNGENIFSLACSFAPARRAVAAGRREGRGDVGGEGKGGRQAAGPLSGLRVLVVEDESHNRLVMGHYLESLGVRCAWAVDGRSALSQLAERGPFDAVLMDWFLPDQTGGKLLERCRGLMGKEVPPVIVVSAFATVAKREECLRAGAMAFISKPVTEETVRDALVRVSGRRDERQRNDSPDLRSTPGFDKTTRVELRRGIAQQMRRVLAEWDQKPEGVVEQVHRIRGQLVFFPTCDLAEQLEVVEACWDEKGVDRTMLHAVVADAFAQWEQAEINV